jgi:cytochrome oxidase Cu insertion factor (SCO1/SenC/PrrC family)
MGVALIMGWPSSPAQGGETPALPENLAAVEPATPMPVFSLPGLNGEAFKSAALQGQVVVVRFWATW